MLYLPRKKVDTDEIMETIYETILGLFIVLVEQQRRDSPRLGRRSVAVLAGIAGHCRCSSHRGTSRKRCRRGGGGAVRRELGVELVALLLEAFGDLADRGFFAPLSHAPLPVEL